MIPVLFPTRLWTRHPGSLSWRSYVKFWDVRIRRREDSNSNPNQNWKVAVGASVSWQLFLGQFWLLIVLPKPFGTFRVSPFQNSMEHRASKIRGKPTNRRSMRWSIDFQGELHHRVQGSSVDAAWVCSLHWSTEWQKSSWENVKQGSIPKVTETPTPAGVGSFVLSQTMFLTIALVPAGFLLFWWLF